MSEQSVVAYLGGYASDLDVVNAARVSYDTEHLEFEDGDDKLIAYLIKNRHGSPFEHGYMKFRIEAPIFVFREWHRHRVGHSYNEMSGRYVELDERFYAPEPEDIRTQEGKTGSYTYAAVRDGDVADEAALIIERTCHHAFQEYKYLLELGVAKEQARCVLPVGTFSQMIWSCNPRSLMHFLGLRNHPRALKEIRDVAAAVEEIFADVMPITHQAFVDNERTAP